MIHGHANLSHTPTTKDYYPCGDMREYNAIIGEFKDRNYLHTSGFAMNLKNHGFIICASSLEMLKFMIKNYKFRYKEIAKVV